MDISRDDIKCIDEYDYQNVTDDDTMTEYSEQEYDLDDDDANYFAGDIDLNIPSRPLMHVNMLNKSKEQQEVFINDISSATEDSSMELMNRRGQMHTGPSNPYLITDDSSYDTAAYRYQYNSNYNKRKPANCQ